jgi:short-subunit dehydrogenase
MAKEKTTKFALVTGATSGIGYELAKQAATDGYHLILVARDQQDLDKVAGELRSTGVEVRTIAKDLFNEQAAQEVYDAVSNMGIKIHLLINDAGQGQYGYFVQTDLQRHLEIIRLNIISLVSLTHLFLVDMLARNEGKILQLGSEVSKTPMPMMAVYAATKAFVLSFTEALINELKGSNVSMTLLMPGATDTDFFDKAAMEDTKIYREGKLDSPVKVARLAYKALQKGKRRIIGPAGRKNVAMANLMPDNMVAESNRKKMVPSSKSRTETRQKPAHKRSREEKEKAKPIRSAA